jgi:hypothetical protein
LHRKVRTHDLFPIYYSIIVCVFKICFHYWTLCTFHGNRMHQNKIKISWPVLLLIMLGIHNLRPCVLYIYKNLFQGVSFCALLQVLLAGQGLNDNQWHTLRFSRRGSNLKLQVDDDSPIRGKYILYRIICNH